jgi:hypothetical protein
MEQWMVVAVAALGVAGQWWVGSRASARRDGAVDEKLRSHDARLEKHGEEIDDLRDRAASDRGRIGVVETRLAIGKGSQRS